MHNIINIYQHHLSAIHTTLAVIGASGLVTLVLQKLKHWLSLQNDHVIHLLLIVFSFSTVCINYALNAASASPSILGSQTFLIVGVASTIYKFGLKPAQNILNDARVERVRRSQTLSNTAEVNSVSVPDTAGEFIA